MRWVAAYLSLAIAVLTAAPTPALAWGGFGHRTVAAIAAKLLPTQKVARINAIMAQLEIDNNFIDGASYPDEYVRDHDPSKSPWHFSDLPDDGSPFQCGNNCLFQALDTNLSIVRQGNGDYDEAVALAWVIHLTGDLHQPLHMEVRLRGGNDFHVTYRGKKTCKLYSGKPGKVELHSAWDDCLIDELAAGQTPDQLATSILGPIASYQGRPELAGVGAQPWLPWGDQSHALAVSVAFGSLQDGADLDDGYIVGQGAALDVVRQQLLAAGIRLAYLLDQSVT